MGSLCLGISWANLDCRWLAYCELSLYWSEELPHLKDPLIAKNGHYFVLLPTSDYGYCIYMIMCKFLLMQSCSNLYNFLLQLFVGSFTCHKQKIVGLHFSKIKLSQDLICVLLSNTIQFEAKTFTFHFLLLSNY